VELAWRTTASPLLRAALCCPHLVRRNPAVNLAVEGKFSTYADESALIVVSAIQSSGKENVGKENNKSSIFLSYIFLSAGRNDDRGTDASAIPPREALGRDCPPPPRRQEYLSSPHYLRQ
jgi:hypothetical protein